MASIEDILDELGGPQESGGRPLRSAEDHAAGSAAPTPAAVPQLPSVADLQAQIAAITKQLEAAQTLIAAFVTAQRTQQPAAQPVPSAEPEKPRLKTYEETVAEILHDGQPDPVEYDKRWCWFNTPPRDRRAIPAGRLPGAAWLGKFNN
jgi:hypothetical protein